MRLLTLTLFACSFGLLKAQLPAVDITMVPVNAQQYQVRLRPDENFNGFFSSLVFTIRWSNSTPLTLAEFVPVSSMIALGIYPALSGEVVESGEYSYAPHVAFGASSLSAQGQSWAAGQEVLLGTISIESGSGVLEVINDQWTAQNNADYFVSLNGINRTGVVYSSSTGVNSPELSSPQAYLHVQNGRINLVVSSLVTNSGTYELFDVTGRTIAQGGIQVAEGRSEHALEHPALSQGHYSVVLRSSGSTQVLRTVVGY